MDRVAAALVDDLEAFAATLSEPDRGRLKQLLLRALDPIDRAYLAATPSDLFTAEELAFLEALDRDEP